MDPSLILHKKRNDAVQLTFSGDAAPVLLDFFVQSNLFKLSPVFRSNTGNVFERSLHGHDSDRAVVKKRSGGTSSAGSLKLLRQAFGWKKAGWGSLAKKLAGGKQLTDNQVKLMWILLQC